LERKSFPLWLYDPGNADTERQTESMLARVEESVRSVVRKIFDDAGRLAGRSPFAPDTLSQCFVNLAFDRLRDVFVDAHPAAEQTPALSLVRRVAPYEADFPTAEVAPAQG
jgi:hypothetical protein